MTECSGCIVPTTSGSIHRRIAVQDSLSQMQDPSSKITNAKRAGGVAQVEPAQQAQGPEFNPQYCQKKKQIELTIASSNPCPLLCPHFRSICIITCLHIYFARHGFEVIIFCITIIFIISSAYRYYFKD
jgi:hypothetical protein